MQKNTRNGLIALAVLAVLVLAAVMVYFVFMPQISPSAEMKDISVTVVHGDGSEKIFQLKTQAETLGEALVAEGLVEGEDGPYGLYILSVDGETVDENLQQWWCLTKGGQQHNHSADSTVLTQGDSYELTFTQGW